MKVCSTCGVEIKNIPYLYMNAGGESTLSEVIIYDEKLLLCPKCTGKLNVFLHEMLLENKERAREHIKKRKLINISDYKKNL